MIPLTQWCERSLHRAAVPGVAVLATAASCAGATGLNPLSSSTLRAHQPLTGPAATIDRPLVGHGDVPEKVKLTPGATVMNPRHPRIPPVLGDPLIDLDHFPPDFSDIKDTYDFTDRNWSASGDAGRGDHSSVPTPGGAALIALASCGLFIPRRRRL